MTAKDKAKDLYKMYNNLIVEQVIKMKPTYLLMTHEMAKKSALILVDEMINSSDFNFENPNKNTIYWLIVKQEIKNL